MNEQSISQALRKKQTNPCLWLFTIVSAVLIAWPILRVWPLVTLMISQSEFNAASSDIKLVELGHSQHFVIIGPIKYMSEIEVQAYLNEAEARRTQLTDYLWVAPQVNRTTVYVYPQWGIGHFDPPDSIYLYALKTGRNGLIHELTHLLMGYSNSFLSEGLAVMTEEQFGWGMAFPNFLRPVDACLYAMLREGYELQPLSTLLKSSFIWVPSEVEKSQLRYLQAGSFVKFMVKEYKLNKYLEVYQGFNFQNISNHSIRELETEWLAHLTRSHLKQALTLGISWVAVLILAHIAILRDKSWFLTTIVSWAAFTAWSFYLAYLLRVPGGLLAAIIAGGTVGQWRHSWGLLTLWVLGIGSLVVFILWFPIMSYLGWVMVR